MATVRITEAIRYHVKQKIEAMYGEMHRKERQKLDALPIATQLLDIKLPARERELARQLDQMSPDRRWFGTFYGFNCTVRLDDDYYHFTAKLPVPQIAPYGTPNYWSTEVPHTLPCFPQIEEICERLGQITNERDRLIETLVKGVLTECRTLRQVLEHWPSALDFMPDAVKIKHAEKTDTAKRKKPDITVDESTKAALIKARMLTGQ